MTAGFRHLPRCTVATRLIAAALLGFSAACSAAHPGSMRGLAVEAAGPSSLESSLRRQIRELAPDTAEVAVAWMDLETGDSVLIDARTPMHAASTMKIPVMIEVFRRIDAGETTLTAEVPVRNRFRSIADTSTYQLDPAEDSDPEIYRQVGEVMPLGELVERMIARSSNLATNLLIERVGAARVRRTLDELDAGEMRVLRGVEDGPAYRAGLNNTTTAYGLLKTMQALADGRAASPQATREMIRILEQQKFREMIPAGLPEGVPVANKTGWITGIHHDAAIVFPPGRAPYVMVVLTRGFADADEAARVGAALSRTAWTSVAQLSPR